MPAGTSPQKLGFESADEHMIRRTSSCLIIAVVMASACRNEPAPAGRTPDAIFPLRESDYPIGADAAQANPQIVQHLIAQQRQLFSILAGKERTQLRDYVDATYVWRYATSQSARVPAGQRPRANADSLAARVAANRAVAGYLALFGGIVPDGLQPMPTDYHVFLQGAFADVIATHNSDSSSFVTAWHLTTAGWRAIETRELRGTRQLRF